MRTLSSAGLAALDTGRFTERCLVKVFVPDDPFLIWDDIGDIVVDEETYIGKAGAFTFEPSPSAYDDSARAGKLTISGIDPSALALIEGAPWHQAPIYVRRAIIAVDMPQVLHLQDEFFGYVDQMLPRQQIGGDYAIEWLCETEARELSRSGAATRSDSDQRSRDSEDGFLSPVASAIATTIDWGRLPQKQQQKPGGIAGILDKWF